jgi:uncharacterized protein (TIGR02421 family)
MSRAGGWTGGEGPWAARAAPSSAAAASSSTIDGDLVESLRARIERGLPVRRRLPGGGRLHVDRPLPFLCVHRAASGGRDPATADLVRTQASHLVAPSDPVHHGWLSALVAAVVEALAEGCGACLLLELWAADPAERPGSTIRIVTPFRDELATTVSVLAEALGAMTLPTGALEVEVVAGDGTPPGCPPLLPPAMASHAGCLLIGLELPSVHRGPTGAYPLVVRALSRELARVLQQGFFEFARVQTASRPSHHQLLGRRRMVRSVRAADRALVELASGFDFLLDVTPVNTDEAWTAFRRGGHREAPALHYRMLAVDPELVKRRLYAVPLERLEDPVLALLLRDKRRELDRQLTLLDDRGDERFLPGSIALYGGVEDSLLAEAEAILAAVPAPPAEPPGPRCDGLTVALRAQEEIASYRANHPALAATVTLSDDVPSLVVSRGNLLVPRGLSVAAERVAPLLQHEVGTHVVTYANGRAQPLQVFAAGLAGYEALQEGLAMFAEHLAGGLGARRLRLIAVRVVAVRRMIGGTSFADLFAELVEQHGIGPRAAFGVAIRVFRGGGLTKDAIYLRGLRDLLAHLASGGSLEPMLVGKIALDQVPFVEELLRRQVLQPAALRPRWLDDPAAAARLQRARAGLRAIHLIDPMTSNDP